MLCYNSNKILIIRLDYIYRRGYIKRWFKKKDRNMSDFYSYSKSWVAKYDETKWILIYLSSCQNWISNHQAINKVKSDNDDLLSE